MRKRQLYGLLISVPALSFLIVHALIPSKKGTVLAPMNIASTIVLLLIVFSGCLYSLSETRYITWKNTIFLFVVVGMLLVFRYSLSIPKVIQNLGALKYTFLIVLYQKHLSK